MVVDMKNTLFADAIAAALRNYDSDFEVFQSEAPEKTAEICADEQANILIVEVMDCTSWKTEERIKVIGEVKKAVPDCKTVLAVDENTEKSRLSRYAAPDNDYTPTEPFTITIESNHTSEAEQGYMKLFIPCGGADSPRPIKLRMKGDGKWFLWEQYLLTDIRQPKSADPWA